MSLSYIPKTLEELGEDLAHLTKDSLILAGGTDLVLHLRARNNGATRVNNMNFEAAVLDLDGRELLRRQCNVVQPTPPGEALDHRWTIELDAASPTGQKVRAAGALTCRPIWKTLGLANGEVLHITDLPDQEEELR